jgi:lipoprotein NlpI
LEERHIREARKSQYLLAGLVSLITFVVYLSCLQNGFVNWDDDLYVYENPNIRSLNIVFLKWAFLHYHAGFWIPVTWISFAMDYAMWGLNPLGYHLINNVLHAINTFTVVLLMIRLMEVSKRSLRGQKVLLLLDKKPILVAGAAVGLLFGLHPVHVESVAWVTERKDLLSAFFFLLGIFAYTKYVTVLESKMIRDNAMVQIRNKYYLLSFVLFILALLSKPMAVSLPVVLLILDWYPFGRISSLRTLGVVFAEKLPFIALSLLSSITTLFAQKAQVAMSLSELTPFSTRILVGIEALFVYLYKMLVPLNLVPLYPYPRNVSFFSSQYLSSIVLAVGITLVCVITTRTKKLWFAIWAYYVITLIPVIDIIQSGVQSMADRFTYLPSIGPLLVVGLVVAWISTKVDKLKKWRATVTLVSISCAVLLILSITYLTVKQIGIWKKSMTLWSYVIKKEPQSVPLAYNNRGVVFEEMGKFDKAIEDFDKAIALNPGDPVAYNNRGLVFEKMGKFDKAIEDFDKTISLNPFYPGVYKNRGVVFGKTGKFDKAIEDFDKAIALNPGDPVAYNNRGLVFDRMGRFDRAIEDFDKAIALDHSYTDAHYNRGIVYYSTGRFDRAMADFQKACDLGDKDACNKIWFSRH